MNSNTPFILYFYYCRLRFWGILNKLGYPLQNSPQNLANSYKSGINFRNTQFSLRMRIIFTSHKHYNNFGRIYIENVLKFTQFVRRNICGDKY